jgi:hypothetical protein
MNDCANPTQTRNDQKRCHIAPTIPKTVPTMILFVFIVSVMKEIAKIHLSWADWAIGFMPCGEACEHVMRREKDRDENDER